MMPHRPSFPALCGFAVAALTLVLAVPALAGKQAVVASSSSVSGETISCGCKKKDLGGLARRATLIHEHREGNDAFLLVDAGNFASNKPEEEKPWVRTTFQWEMMRKLGYDAVTPGSYELLPGLETLQALFAGAPEIQVVSANITDKKKNLLWPESTVITKGGVKFGITGITTGAYYSFNVARGKQASDDFAFLDEREALERVVPRLRKEADVVVALLQTSPSDATRILEELPGIDVAIVGHNPGYLFTPDQINETLVVRAGKRGQYFSILNLMLDDSGRIQDFQGEGLPLGEAVDPDPEFEKIVAAFNAKHGFKDNEEEDGTAHKAGE